MEKILNAIHMNRDQAQETVETPAPSAPPSPTEPSVPHKQTAKLHQLREEREKRQEKPRPVPPLTPLPPLTTSKEQKAAPATPPLRAQKPAVPGFDPTTKASKNGQKGGLPPKDGYSRTRVIPFNAEHFEYNRIIAHDKQDARIVHFDMLRTNVLQKMEKKQARTLAITSPMEGCGKSVTAINLAISISFVQGRTALLVDLDLRRPKIAEYMGMPAQPSLIDYIERQADLPDVLLNPGIRDLVIIPNGQSVINASETLTDQRMVQLVSELRERYHTRTIIFDLPPLLSSDDAMAFLPQVDAVLLVVANGKTSTPELQESMRILSQFNYMGSVLTGADPKTGRYY